MLNNFFTLEAILNEIRDDIESSTVTSAYTRSRKSLDIVSIKKGRKPSLIKVSCAPAHNYLFLRKDLSSTPTGVKVFPNIIGIKIIAAEAVKFNRIVIFYLSNQQRLVIKLFGIHSNVYLIDNNNKVIDRFLKHGMEPGDEVDFSPEKLTSQFKEPGVIPNFMLNVTPTIENLLSSFPYLSRELALEIVFRFQKILQDSNYSLDKSDSEQTLRQTLINETLKEVFDELAHPAPHIYYKLNKPYLFSIIKLNHLSDLKFEACKTVNDGIMKYVSKTDKVKEIENLKESLTQTIKKKIADTKRTITKIEKELSENREKKYRKYAETLMANFDAIPKGSSSYTTKDGDELITIPLDPKLKAIENAQLYYEKAKKAKISQSKTTHRKEQLELVLKNLETELYQIGLQEDQQKLKQIAKKGYLIPSTQTKFRQFNQEGYVIYVGKNARNNEELTFNYARPNDIFLHARGVSGSHVIIRNQSKNYPPKKIIEYAAELAAYYSKASSSSIVPVTYTMKKYVKKAKDQPGAVRVDREEVIFVSPPRKPASQE